MSGNATITEVDFGFYGDMDCGDLPATYYALPTVYRTLLSAEGPCHVRTSSDPNTQNYSLGMNWDRDVDGQPNSQALG